MDIETKKEMLKEYEELTTPIMTKGKAYEHLGKKYFYSASYVKKILQDARKHERGQL